MPNKDEKRQSCKEIWLPGRQAGKRGRGCCSRSSSSKTLHYNLCACKPRSLPLNPCLITRNECSRRGEKENGEKGCSLSQARQGRVDSQAWVVALSTLWASVWGKQFSKICLNSLRLRWKFMLRVCVCLCVCALFKPRYAFYQPKVLARTHKYAAHTQ